MNNDKKEDIKEFIFKVPEYISYGVAKINAANNKADELLKTAEYREYVLKSLEYIDSKFREIRLTFINKNSI